MRCTHCEKCCEKTEMELCRADVTRLERQGYKKEDFSRPGTDGIWRLLNVGSYCFFYDHDRKRCKEYKHRPLGCVLYPVNITEDGGIVIDELCPEGDTLTAEEIDNKSRRLRRLIDTMVEESSEMRSEPTR